MKWVSIKCYQFENNDYEISGTLTVEDFNNLYNFF